MSWRSVSLPIMWLNPALKDKQLDANFFQHIPYLEDYNAKNNANLVWIVKSTTNPWESTPTSMTALTKWPACGRIGIPNDATNGGRALMVLESAGLLKLKEVQESRQPSATSSRTHWSLRLKSRMPPCCPGL